MKPGPLVAVIAFLPPSDAPSTAPIEAISTLAELRDAWRTTGEEMQAFVAGLDDAALVSREGGEATRIALDRRWTARLPVEVPAGGMSWWVFRAP